MECADASPSALISQRIRIGLYDFRIIVKLRSVSAHPQEVKQAYIFFRLRGADVAFQAERSSQCVGPAVRRGVFCHLVPVFRRINHGNRRSVGKRNIPFRQILQQKSRIFSVYEVVPVQVRRGFFD